MNTAWVLIILLGLWHTDAITVPGIASHEACATLAKELREHFKNATEGRCVPYGVR